MLPSTVLHHIYTPVSWLLFVVLSPGRCAAAPQPADIDSRHALQRRDVISDLTQNLPSNLRDDVTQGITQNWWSGIPVDEAAVRKAFKLSSLDSLNAETQFLNIPGYANYTNNSSWNVRIRGQMATFPYYKLPQRVQDELAEIFVPNVDMNALTPAERDNARNLTGMLFSVPKSGQEVKLHLKWAGESPGSTGQGWEQRLTWPRRTDSAGEIEGFVQLADSSRRLPRGIGIQGGHVGVLDVWTEGIESGNSTAYLVPEEGITILSDIDDILRVTKIYDPQEGLLNTFARDFVPWLNMPSIFASWSRQRPPTTNTNGTTSSISPYHFHYLTTTPEQATRVYMDFIYTHYPLGSFDTRPLNFTTAAQTFHSRQYLLYKIFQTFPKRKFVLIGDTTNNDVLTEYPDLPRVFPGQVACILIRNVTATEPQNRLPYNTRGFQNLKSEQYMFFNTPDDLTGIDFYRGQCRNASISQPTTFGWQNVPGNGGLNLRNIAGGRLGVDKLTAGLTFVVALAWTLL